MAQRGLCFFANKVFKAPQGRQCQYLAQLENSLDTHMLELNNHGVFVHRNAKFRAILALLYSSTQERMRNIIMVKAATFRVSVLQAKNLSSQG